MSVFEVCGGWGGGGLSVCLLGGCKGFSGLVGMWVFLIGVWVRVGGACVCVLSVCVRVCVCLYVSVCVCVSMCVCVIYV